MIRAAVLMVVYAALVIGLGAVTFLLAPAGANALTALIVPGVGGLAAMACAVMTVMGRSPGADGRASKAGMIGVHAGMAVPLVLIAGAVMRAAPGTGRFLDAKRAFTADDAGAQLLGRALAGEDVGEQAEALTKDYQLVGLWGVAGVSVMALAGLVALRPRVPKQPASPVAGA